MPTPEIIYTGKGKDRRIAITDDLREFLKGWKGKKTELASELHVSRPTLDRLFSECGIQKRETKKQKVVRKIAEQIANEVQKQAPKERQKVIKAAAKDIIKNKTLMERMTEAVRGKDGQPLQYNGEALTTEAMMDISLINQAKESPQANISLRAQVMALQLEEERQKELKDRKAMLTRLQKQKDKRTKQMQQSLQDKGIFTDMTHTMLETWGNAWELMKIAEWNWKRRGGETIEVQITAQAQRIERPNQLYETYRNALKAYNDADQKLRAAVAAYFKLVNGDNDEGASEGDAIGAEIMKILNQS